jgi:hypothetical protein
MDVHLGTGLLASWGAGRTRLSAPHDVFHVDDSDHTAESNQETGHAWSVAGFVTPRPPGVEHLHL